MACPDGQYFCNDRQKCMPISKKKYEESTSMKTSMKNVDPKDRKVIRSRQKNLFKKDLTGEHQGINELDTKEYKKLNKASVGMMSSDPKVQDKARERQTEIDYKDLLSQIKRRKVKQGKSMKESAKDQSSKQLDRGMKTTQKAMGVIDNSPYGGLSDDKIDRMNKRLKNRRKDVSGEKISRLTKSLGEGNVDVNEGNCKCSGCAPDGVGHQNPCVECGGHHKDKLSERLETFRGSHAERRKEKLEDNIKRINARMKYGKVAGDPDSRIGRKTYDKWQSDVKASLAKNKLRPGEVKRYDNVHQKWVSNKN